MLNTRTSLRFSLVVGLVAIFAMAASPGLALGQHSKGKADGGGAATGGGSDEVASFTRYPDSPSVTYHTAVIHGQVVPYTATCGTISLVDKKDEPTADVFYISYTRTRLSHEDWVAEGESYRAEHGEDSTPPSNELDPTTRPVTFSFNGGPGSSSVWLHLGLFGPMRVRYADDMGNPGPPPYGVVENDSSLLDRSDFVFIDPVSTGYSRVAGDTKAKSFHGVEEDIRSVGSFIQRYLTKENRWGSPKYLAGESYGTTRAAGLSSYLGERYGISLNGIILISIALDFNTLRFGPGADLPYILYLPTYAATAHYHGKLSPRLQARSVDDVIREAEAFASGAYATALLKGDGLSESESAAIASEMARLTGLDVDYIRRANLRVSIGRFAKELRRDDGLTVGRLDARFTGLDRDDAGESFEFDPSYSAIYGNYTGALNSYVRTELGYESDLPYEILTGSVHPWNYSTGGRRGAGGSGGTLNMAERLRVAMHQQPHMRVLVVCGQYDLATPHFAADYTLSHMQIDESLRGNIGSIYFPAGHMMYLHRQSLERLKSELDAWYDAAP